MNVFICTMPINLLNRGSYKPLSIALISEDAKYSFYAEIIDGYELNECAWYVHEEILPKLNAARLGKRFNKKHLYAQMTLQECRVELTNWLARMKCDVRLLSDADLIDWGVLDNLFADYPWPSNLSKRTPEDLSLHKLYGRMFDMTKKAIADHMRLNAENMYDSVRAIAAATKIIETRPWLYC
jgi:hypothetical protein